MNFGRYTKNYFVWGKYPYFTRKNRAGKNLTQRYCHYLHLVPSDLNTVMDVAKQIVNL